MQGARSTAVSNSTPGDGLGILAALEHAPFTRQHARFLTALLAALIFDYSKPFTVAFVIPGMREMWSLSEASAAYLPMASLSGTAIGVTFWGFMADRIGRRPALLWTVGIFMVTSLCGLAVSYWHSLLACLLMGMGVGGEVPIVFALATEYLPTRIRGRALLFLGVVGSIGGYAVAASTAAIVKAFYPEVVAWRLLWLLSILPAAVVLTFLVLRSNVVPESARYLISRNRADEARRAAEFLIGPISNVVAREERASIAPARIPRLYARTFVLAFFSFAWGLANFGFVTWLPTILATIGYSGATSAAYLSLSAVIALPFLVVTTLLFTKWSTRWTIIGYALGGAVIMALLGAMVSSRLLTPLLLVALTSLVFFFVISIGSAFALYAAEVYPTPMRGSRTGIVSGAGRIGGVIGPYFGGLWLTSGGAVSSLYIVLATGLVAAAGVFAVSAVETRGKTLEQINSTTSNRP